MEERFAKIQEENVERKIEQERHQQRTMYETIRIHNIKVSNLSTGQREDVKNCTVVDFFKNADISMTRE